MQKLAVIRSKIQEHKKTIARALHKELVRALCFYLPLSFFVELFSVVYYFVFFSFLVHDFHFAFCVFLLCYCFIICFKVQIIAELIAFVVAAVSLLFVSITMISLIVYSMHSPRSKIGVIFANFLAGLSENLMMK